MAGPKTDSLSPFERFVRAIAKVPKTDLDAVKGAEPKPLTKRGPKPKQPGAPIPKE